MRRGMRALGIVALAAAVLAAACGGTSSGDKTKTAAAGGATNPAGTQTANATPAASGSAAAAASPVATTTYPLTVTDMLGRSVTIAKKPATVAAISPTTVEYVYAVGSVSKTRSSSDRKSVV